MIRPINLHITTQKGRRDQNEDMEEYLLNLKYTGDALDNNCSPIDFFLICDGHGGKEVAEYIAPKLKHIFTKKGLIYPLSETYINKIFYVIQNKLAKDQSMIGYDCGSTALIIIRYKNSNNGESIQIINLGDCRAVLSKNGKAYPLTVDHKPSTISESNRIKEINDKLYREKKYDKIKTIEYHDGDYRVNGLSVCRALGDVESGPQVAFIPDIKNIDLDGNEDFIIMACDGLWDVFDNEDAVKFISDHLNNNDKNYVIENKYPMENVKKTNCLARKIASYAIALGSGDNISVFVIIFRNN